MLQWRKKLSSGKKKAKNGQTFISMDMYDEDRSLTDKTSQRPLTSTIKAETGSKAPFSKIPLTKHPTQALVGRLDRRSKILSTEVSSRITSKSPRLVSPVASNAHSPTQFTPLCRAPGHCPLPTMCLPEAVRRDASKKAPLMLHQVTNADVLCGRGAGTNTHPGNVKFRALVSQYQMAYLKAKALEKTEIAKTIVQKIRCCGGSFLKKIESSQEASRWYDIGDKAAREKTCQALRERGPTAGEFPALGIPRTTSESENFISEAEVDVEKYDHSTLTGAVPSTFKPQVIPTDRDILLGRGGVTNTHAGNKYYRDLVRRRQPDYLSSPKMQKALISKSIVEEIHTNGGRFLRDMGDGTWQVVSKEKAKEKTSQALREKAPEMRRVYLAAASLVDTNKVIQNPESTAKTGMVATHTDTRGTTKALPTDSKEGQGSANGKENGSTRRGPLYKKQKIRL